MATFLLCCSTTRAVLLSPQTAKNDCKGANLGHVPNPSWLDLGLANEGKGGVTMCGLSGLFFMFYNFCQLDIHDKTHVALASLR